VLDGRPKSEADGRAASLLVKVGLDKRKDHLPAELSGGEIQRVAIARALSFSPPILLADEPTSNLDDERCAQALELLQGQARACNATLLIATHDQRIKARMPEQFVLGGGR